MANPLAFFFVLRGTSSPIVATALLLALATYQLASGKLLNARWGIWTTRAERLRLYWSIVAVEMAIALFSLCACFL
jgi:hypothetical protein